MRLFNQLPIVDPLTISTVVEIEEKLLIAVRAYLADALDKPLTENATVLRTFTKMVGQAFDKKPKGEIYINDNWYGTGGKLVARHWLEQSYGWCVEETHFHMTLEDYLAAVLGLEAGPGKRNFFELLPDENKERPAREFADFFKLAGGENGTDDSRGD